MDDDELKTDAAEAERDDENDEAESLQPTEADERGSGVSSLAIPASKQWDAGDRPEGWQGRVYGLVVHTTGSRLPASARERGLYHTVRAVDYYSQSHGCHYVNGWQGVEGGDLLQLANEREEAHGVGVTNNKEPSKDQRRSIDLGRFEADLPPTLVRLWQARWPGFKHSLELLPGTKTVNSCYVHVECVPCVYHFDGNLATDAEPLGPGLRFTRAQHDTVALLAVDVARRNGWPLAQPWWRTSRLVGHEDLTPISRHDKRGGWDPGYLREQPYFDWDYVYDAIERTQRGPVETPGSARTSSGQSMTDVLGDLAQRFADLIASGQERRAVSLAHERGVRDENEIANLLFFARHPDMNGRKIEPHETALAQEWLQIRDDVVRPVVDALAATAGGSRPPA